ncbi:pyridoxamine 5'-phosphate oxidase family protein [Thermoleptolyngbya sichuanensis A183]|uniref:Pyridoxamine 5'-phosphate oxidase family protein n=1 Tax=Thermoleptolyngbya sichuanensis A183 TaxID=2737172 RepID=A0A6M8BAF4_9CYAN|nr:MULTISPECIES: pyridoxamine 5'-phosphate oxidase family protein [Thermoleptolyngbya]QKD83558.1 pyridoxamine 5'-phosphate oxidase family protein [Thermoleptolyngbya sichuanensis A183]
MAQQYDSLTPKLQDFIAQQQIFFVASAPLSAEGHINLSPKGLDSFRILSPHRVAYLDLTGSGNETSAHVQENGRITLMFCAFQGPPLILRIYGQGTTILPRSPEWDTLYPLFPPLSGARQILHVEVAQVQTSCGMGVPRFGYEGQRNELIDWASQKGEDGLNIYRQTKNRVSLDGLTTPLGAVDR